VETNAAFSFPRNEESISILIQGYPRWFYLIVHIRQRIIKGLINLNYKNTLLLSLGALGVVYGDLGTSPIYALQQSISNVAITETNILGLLSLIFWSLILVISTCYVTVFLKADNDGEGGVLALLSLIKRHVKQYPKILFFLGVFGAGLLLGDGMLTPSISVISALEGLTAISPDFSHLITPIAFVILLILFSCQKFGTEKIGFIFGPIILVWFIAIGFLGGLSIYHNPIVLYAINPYHAYLFAIDNGLNFLPMLSGIFLVITGAEAMYADLGHFGKTPIRLGWFLVALPSVLLNYFGQGAYVLAHPENLNNLFYSLSPSWFNYPLLLLATFATIIASQAVITASFSLIHQAILLNIFPRLLIKHTSSKEKGQIYIPHLNLTLAIGTLSLVLIFKKSSALAAAYGIAVNLVMIIVAILVICVARSYWSWSLLKIVSIFSVFMFIDVLFLIANLHKLHEGGWIPIAVASGFAFIMFSWREGMLFLQKRYYQDKISLSDLFAYIDSTQLIKLKEITTVFITNNAEQSIGSFLHYLKLNRIIPARALIVNVAIKMHPYVPDRERYEIEQIMQDVYKLTLNYGFMQTINIPQTILEGSKMNVIPLSIDPNKLTYFVEIINIDHVKTNYFHISYWKKRVFAFLLRNALVDIKFYGLPYNRTIALGSYCEM